MAEDYTAPVVVELGTLHELTLRNKTFGRPNDGDFVFGFSLTTIAGS